MKMFIMVLTVTTTALAGIGEDQDNAVAACIERFNIEESTLRTTLETQDFSNIDKNWMCFFKCMLRTRNTITKDGNFNTDMFSNMKQEYPDSVDKFKSCIYSIEAEESCEKSFEVLKCLFHTRSPLNSLAPK